MVTYVYGLNASSWIYATVDHFDKFWAYYLKQEPNDTQKWLNYLRCTENCRSSHFEFLQYMNGILTISGCKSKIGSYES